MVGSGGLRAALVASVTGAASIAGAAAHAQTHMPTVVIGRIASEKSCTVYQESSGRSAMAATPYGVAASESWRTWLVKDCVDNFATIRTSLEAALASSGKFAVKTGGRGYTLTGTISQVGGDGGPAPPVPSSSGGYSIASRQMFVSMDVTLRDPSGRIVYGGLLTKHLETGSAIHTLGLDTRSSQSGEAVYTELQHQVALAAARLAAFHIDPLRVVGGDGRAIRLNYGSPLLTLGTIVHATSPDGATTVRYTVTAASPEGATAEVDGEGRPWPHRTRRPRQHRRGGRPCGQRAADQEGRSAVGADCLCTPLFASRSSRRQCRIPQGGRISARMRRRRPHRLAGVRPDLSTRLSTPPKPGVSSADPSMERARGHAALRGRERSSWPRGASDLRPFH